MDAKKPIIQCHLVESSHHKQSLKDLSLDKIINNFRSGGITLDELKMLPMDIKKKLPEDIKHQLSQ